MKILRRNIHSKDDQFVCQVALVYEYLWGLHSPGPTGSFLLKALSGTDASICISTLRSVVALRGLMLHPHAKPREPDIFQMDYVRGLRSIAHSPF